MHHINHSSDNCFVNSGNHQLQLMATQLMATQLMDTQLMTTPKAIIISVPAPKLFYTPAGIALSQIYDPQ